MREDFLGMSVCRFSQTVMRLVPDVSRAALSIQNALRSIAVCDLHGPWGTLWKAGYSDVMAEAARKHESTHCVPSLQPGMEISQVGLYPS